MLTKPRYGSNADDLVNDFVSLSSLVTRESLQLLEASYKESQASSTNVYLPQLQAVASRFLGRLWAGSSAHTSTKSLVLNPGPFSPSIIRRTPSKQSMASTLNSFETVSDASTAATELSDSSKRKLKVTAQNQDKDLHTQIEDLLMALTDMQREHATLAKQLQREREEREEDQAVAKSMLSYIKEQPETEQTTELIAKASDRFSTPDSRRLSMQQTKQQLRDDIVLWREKYEIELARCQNLTRTLDEHEHENNQLKDQIREVRARVQDAHRDRQRLERTIQDLRSRKLSCSNASDHRNSGSTENDRSSTSGLREFKLGKAATTPSAMSNNNNNSSSSPQARPTTFSKRTSSIGAPTSFLNADEDSLLAELVTAKTSEAIARQELDEVKAKLESLRKLVAKNGVAIPTTTPATTPGFAENVHLSAAWGALSGAPRSSGSNATPTSGAGGGGFFSGWTKRTLSTSNISIAESK